MFLNIWTISDDFTTTPTTAERKHIPMELMKDSKIVVVTAQILAGSY